MSKKGTETASTSLFLASHCSQDPKPRAPQKGGWEKTGWLATVASHWVLYHLLVSLALGRGSIHILPTPRTFWRATLTRRRTPSVVPVVGESAGEGTLDRPPGLEAIVPLGYRSSREWLSKMEPICHAPGSIREHLPSISHLDRANCGERKEPATASPARNWKLDQEPDELLAVTPPWTGVDRSSPPDPGLC